MHGTTANLTGENPLEEHRISRQVTLATGLGIAAVLVGLVLLQAAGSVAASGCHAQPTTCLQVYSLHWFYFYSGLLALIGGLVLLAICGVKLFTVQGQRRLGALTPVANH